jgi:hypothetical protein
VHLGRGRIIVPVRGVPATSVTSRTGETLADDCASADAGDERLAPRLKTAKKAQLERNTVWACCMSLEAFFQYCQA